MKIPPPSLSAVFLVTEDLSSNLTRPSLSMKIPPPSLSAVFLVTEDLSFNLTRPPRSMWMPPPSLAVFPLTVEELFKVTAPDSCRSRRRRRGRCFPHRGRIVQPYVP